MHAPKEWFSFHIFNKAEKTCTPQREEKTCTPQREEGFYGLVNKILAQSIHSMFSPRLFLATVDQTDKKKEKINSLCSIENSIEVR